MRITKQNANEVHEAIESGQPVSEIRDELSNSEDHWHRLSSKAYAASLVKEKKERKSNEKKRFISVTSTEEVKLILEINEVLSDYALLIPIFSTQRDLDIIKRRISELPNSAAEILNFIGNVTMDPKYRVMQKKGRFESLEPFQNTSIFIDAATLCFYRENYVSCYLTLVPVIEGAILRWMGFEDGDSKPDFKEIRKFFNVSHRRQPHPWNTEFHNIYSKVSHLVLNKHFFRPTDNGESFNDFNRHVASHLLKTSQFATRENCIRLFLLLDTMSEIYVLEQRKNDVRRDLKDAGMANEVAIFSSLFLGSENQSAEYQILISTPQMEE